MPVFLVHGETGAQDTLAELIKHKTTFDVTIPEYLEEMKMKAGAKVEEFKRPPVTSQPLNFAPLLADLKAKIDSINNQLGNIQSLPESRQAELLDLLKQASLNMDEIKIRNFNGRN